MADRSTPEGAGLPAAEPARTLFGAPSDPDPTPAAAPDTDDEGERNPSPEELAAQNRELAARLEENKRTLDALIERPPAAAPTGHAPAPRPVPPSNPGPMPDPTTESEAFKAWMTADRAYRDHQTEERILGIRQDHDRDSLANQLWDDFQREYPEQARDREFVMTAFQAVSGGRIPTDTTGQQRMLKDIADRLKAQAAPAKGDDKAPEPDRTGGLSRGTRPRRTKKSSEPDPVKSLKEQIGDRQVNSPFF